MNIYYVGNMPVSDELYHYGRKGMKWGKDIFSGDAPVQGGGGSLMKNPGQRVRISVNDAVRGTGGSAGRSAINKLKGSVSKTVSKAGEYVTGNQAQLNLDRQKIKEYVHKLNGAPNDIKYRSDFASGLANAFRKSAQDSFDSANSRKFYDLRGKANDNINGIAFEEEAKNLQKLSDDYKKAQNQVNREYREEMRKEANKTAAAQREYDKTLPGSIEKAAKNVNKAVSSTAKSVGDFASKSAKSVSDWGGKQLNKGKSFVSGLFGKKTEPASPKPVVKPAAKKNRLTS